MRQTYVVLTGLLWAGLTAAGFATLLVYQATPGAPGSYTRIWPVHTHVQRQPGQATLILFAHPQCPCTLASLSELARIMAQAGSHLTAYVLFLELPASVDGWGHSRSMDRAKAIPGVRVLPDHSGQEARNFGAETSGQGLLYDGDGILRFSGGITAARGHEGDNPGGSAIVSILLTGQSTTDRTPVFGCSLLNPAAARSD